MSSSRCYGVGVKNCRWFMRFRSPRLPRVSGFTSFSVVKLVYHNRKANSHCAITSDSRKTGAFECSLWARSLSFRNNICDLERSGKPTSLPKFCVLTQMSIQALAKQPMPWKQVRSDIKCRIILSFRDQIWSPFSCPKHIFSQRIKAPKERTVANIYSLAKNLF